MYDLRSGAFLTPGGRQVTMEYRDHTNDWDTLNASLNEDEYGLPQGLTGYALDVGGYLGSVGIALALDNPELYLTVIEPVPANCDLIEQNLRLNHVDDRVELIRGAVGRGGEQVSVGYRYRGSDSFEHHAFVGNFSLAQETPSEHDTVTYTAAGLAEYTPMDFLKIDCEGGEWAFLDTPLVSLVGTIVGEAHAVAGHHGRDIVGLLEATHDVTLIGDGEGTCGFRAVRR